MKKLADISFFESLNPNFQQPQISAMSVFNAFQKDSIFDTAAALGIKLINRHYDEDDKQNTEGLKSLGKHIKDSVRFAVVQDLQDRDNQKEIVKQVLLLCNKLEKEYNANPEYEKRGGFLGIGRSKIKKEIRFNIDEIVDAVAKKYYNEPAKGEFSLTQFNEKDRQIIESLGQGTADDLYHSRDGEVSANRQLWIQAKILAGVKKLGDLVKKTIRTRCEDVVAHRMEYTNKLLEAQQAQKQQTKQNTKTKPQDTNSDIPEDIYLLEGEVRDKRNQVS